MQAFFLLFRARTGWGCVPWHCAALMASVSTRRWWTWTTSPNWPSSVRRNPTALPMGAAPALAALNYDQVRDIRWRPERALWRAEQLPFEAMFFHLGLYQREPVLINEVSPQRHAPHPHRTADFDYGAKQGAAPKLGRPGVCRFLHHHRIRPRTGRTGLQGASYFRALGAGQQYGLSAVGPGH